MWRYLGLSVVGACGVAEGGSWRWQSTKGEIVEELGELLSKAGMQNVLPLPKARVPVVKFVVADNGTKVGAA